MALAVGNRTVAPLICTPVLKQRHYTGDAVSLVHPDTHIPVKYGVGRQGVSGVTATCFGATGFVGRYVVNKLARCGSNCVIPYRGDGYNTRHMKLMGDLGKIVPLPVDFRDEDSLRKTVAKSNVVVNMIGGQFETNNYSYDDTNVKVVHRLCKVAAESGTVKRFIHFSALGADVNSPSALLRAKAVGEQVVRDFFPHATILRPAPIFGDEDKFLNQLANLVNSTFIVPVISNGQQRIQPVSVNDVAQAVVSACVDPDAPGRTFELGGPEVISRAELLQWVTDSLGRNNETIILPTSRFVCKTLARLLAFLPRQKWRYITPDQVDQYEVDLVVNPKAHTLAELGVEPITLQQGAGYALMRHRPHRDIKVFSLPRGDPRRTWLKAPDHVPQYYEES